MAQGQYDHPNYLTRRHFNFVGMGGAATTTYGGLAMPFAGKIRQVTWCTQVAGTATTHGMAIYNGTSSLAAFVPGTSVTQTLGTTADLASIFAAGDRLSFKSLADATGTVNAVVEIEMLPSATWS